MSTDNLHILHKTGATQMVRYPTARRCPPRSAILDNCIKPSRCTKKLCANSIDADFVCVYVKADEYTIVIVDLNRINSMEFVCSNE